ncbi:MAG: TetR/AcrR family transcriptional regulator [Ruthenibacterium sp.]
MAAPRNANIKQQILKSTAALLQTTSFEAITLAGIATAAGISKGTLYYYYNNKDDILLDICEQEIAALIDAFNVWIENKDKDTRAPRLIRYVLQYGTGSALGNLRLYLIGAAVSGHEAVRKRYIELYHSFEQTLTAKLHDRLPHADAEYFAWLLLTTMDGILVQKQLANPYFDADAFLEKTVALCCTAQTPLAKNGTQ